MRYFILERILRHLDRKIRKESQELLDKLESPSYPPVESGDSIIRYYKLKEQHYAVQTLLDKGPYGRKPIFLQLLEKR